MLGRGDQCGAIDGGGLIVFLQGFRFVCQSGQRRRSFLGQFGFARQITFQGHDPRRHLRVLGSNGFGFQRLAVPFDCQPLPGSRGVGFRLAQVRQQSGGLRLQFRCVRRLPRGCLGCLRSFGRCLLRVGFCSGDRLPAEGEQRLLGLSRLRLQGAVAAGLAGLFFQVLALAGDGGEHILQPFQIGVGGAQPRFRLLPAGIEAGDAGGLLQHAAPFGRFGGNERADLALGDDGGRPRAGGGVGQQLLDVAGPRAAPVDAVAAGAAARQAADHFDYRLIAVRRRRQPLMIVKRQRHLGKVTGRPGRCPGKDDVVQFRRPNLPGRAFAHNPAQRLDQIRFAAAVRADNSGQAGLDPQFGRFDEGFKAGKAQAVELQYRSLRLHPSGEGPETGLRGQTGNQLRDLFG